MYILALILVAEVFVWLVFWLTFRPLKRFKKSHAEGKSDGRKEEVDSKSDKATQQGA